MKKKSTIFVVDALYNNYRIDLFLSIMLNISRTKILLLLKNKLIFINKVNNIKQSKKIFTTDIIEILEDNTMIIDNNEELISISIIALYDDFLIIAKPPGISCHKINTRDQRYTVADFARFYWTDGEDDTLRYGIVHRLDKNTSGLLIIARNNKAKNIFMSLFKEHKIKKKYIAYIVKGIIEKSGIIKYAIMRDPLCPVKMTYSFGQGKAAETLYEVIKEYSYFDSVLCMPKTGRTHQLRVHFQAVGHPILGDEIYGKTSMLINRHALHASEISFTYNNINYHFVSPLWQDMEKLISV
jgi:23S rRNA pseudouridine1911/1915/1917 synthase